jgi:hypothetical protein
MKFIFVCQEGVIMSFTKTSVVHTNVNNFSNEEEYFAFIDSFESILADFHYMKRTYVNQGKILSTNRTYETNQITFVTVFDSEESCKQYEQEPSRSIITTFYNDLQWQILSTTY